MASVIIEYPSLSFNDIDFAVITRSIAPVNMTSGKLRLSHKISNVELVDLCLEADAK